MTPRYRYDPKHYETAHEVDFFGESAYAQRQESVYLYWAEYPEVGEEPDEVRCAYCCEEECVGECQEQS
jgi:hypothetical protein